MDAIWTERVADELAVVSPEGTTVRFRLPGPADRLAAFLIDLFLTQLASALVLLAVVAIAGVAPAAAWAVYLIASFFLRNVYFAFVELLWSGQTIGKRQLGLRVIARDGGPLTGQAILARNLTREIEFFLPMVALSEPRRLLPFSEGWSVVLAVSWLAVFAALPLLNREHLRCGDFLGGTVVVRLPKLALLSDLALRDTRGPAYLFSPAHLDVYGIEELQVLETVLRRAAERDHPELVDGVRERIQRKIRWTAGGRVDSVEFLRAFYEAQRAHLERKMVFGVRKERKER